MVNLTDGFTEEKRFQEPFKKERIKNEDTTNKFPDPGYVWALLCASSSHDEGISRAAQNKLQEICSRAGIGIYGVDTGDGPDFTNGVSCLQTVKRGSGTGDDV